MPSIYTIIAYYSWLLIYIVWFPGYFSAKRTIKRPNPVRRIVAMILIAGGFGLIFSNQSQSWQTMLTPQTDILGSIGLTLDIVSIFFAVWARITIGNNWSNAITLKEGHELVQSGPYRIVRHPIYTGLLFAALGIALTLGTFTAYLGVVVALSGILIRMRDEEALMTRQFPDHYPTYSARTKKLVPFVW